MTEPIVFSAHTNHIPALIFTPDSGTLISGGMDNVIKLWSVPDWELRGTLFGHEKSVNSLALSADHETLASGSSDATVRLWSLSRREPLTVLRDRKKVVAAVRFSPDGMRVAAASYGGRAMVWTVTGEPVCGIRVSRKNSVSIAFSGDGETLAAGGLGDDISIWALPSGNRIATLTGHNTAVISLQFVEGEHRLISLGYEQTVRVWDSVTWQHVRSLRVPEGGARGLAVSPDEETVALSLEGKIVLRSMAGWDLRAELPVTVKAIYGTTFSPDGRWLAAGAADGKLRVWRLEDTP